MEGKLRRTIHNALNQAEACDARSVVIPPLGAGFHGVPLDMCCRVMIESIKSRLSGETKLREITICALDNREYAPFQQALRQQFGKGN